jgi:hypothetical protein
MYGTIRRYNFKTAQDQKALDGLKQRLDTGFMSQLQDIQGFHSYYVMSLGGKQLVTITVCDDKSGTTESTRRAAEFVKTDSLKDQFSTPEIIEGELLLAKESAVGTR